MTGDYAVETSMSVESRERSCRPAWRVTSAGRSTRFGNLRRPHDDALEFAAQNFIVEQLVPVPEPTCVVLAGLIVVGLCQFGFISPSRRFGTAGT
jgi:hypothetical protein